MRRRKNRLSVFLIFLLIAGIAAMSLPHALRLGYPTEYSEYVERWAARYDVDPLLIYSFIRAESGFNADAVSSQGALGIMQITPPTFNWLQTKTGDEYSENALYDPDICIRYGVLLISMNLAEFGDLTAAAAAYHAGRTCVANWLCDPDLSPDGATLSRIPYKDTENYVNKIKRNYSMYRRLYN